VNALLGDPFGGGLYIAVRVGSAEIEGIAYKFLQFVENWLW
jgi:hypothetical protein